MTSIGAPRRPALAMVQPVEVRLTAICSLPIGAPRRKMVKLVAPASGSVGGTGGCWADAAIGTAIAAAASAARIK